MKRILFLLAIALLALPATALAKGPTEASIKGPGLGKPIKMTGAEGQGRLGDLAQQAGFFPAAFGQDPNPMLPARPKGDLGPKYTIDYTVPGSNSSAFQIRQDVYPYASPSAVSYMPSGQRIFDFTTRGGWFESEQLKDALVTAGLPRSPVAASTSSGAGFLSTGRLGVLVLVLVLLGTTTVAIRRRVRLSPTA
jgi:hypothetical protein